jgi:hypothetical protein
MEDLKQKTKEELEMDFISELDNLNFENCVKIYKSLPTVNFGNSSYLSSSKPQDSTLQLIIDSISAYKVSTYPYPYYITYPDVQAKLTKSSHDETDQMKHRPNPLITMSCKGNLKAVQFLVENLYADVNFQSLHQTTPIMYAFQHGHTDIVVYLLSKGAHTQVKTLSRTIKMTDYGRKDNLSSHMDLINFLLSQQSKSCQETTTETS